MAPGAIHSKEELLLLFFSPPPSALDQRLRATIPPAATAGFSSLAKSQAHQLGRRCIHAATCVPDAAVVRILEGGTGDESVPGSFKGQVTETARRKASLAIARRAGKSGESLSDKLSKLARFADFAAAGGFERGTPTDIFEGTVPPSLTSDFLTLERARGFHEGSIHLAASALSAIAFAVAHLGLDAPGLKSDLVKSSARMSLEEGAPVPKPAHAGCRPLRSIAGSEALANSNGGTGPSSSATPVWFWTCARLIAFTFGLRDIELRSAKLEPELDIRYIHISFHPKGNADKPRILAWRFAWGVLGPYLWWPKFRTLALGAYQTLAPAYGKGQIWDPKATLQSRVAPASCKGGTQLLSLDHFGISPEEVALRGLTNHSDHGSMNAIVGHYGTELGFDPPADGLILGHWLGTTRAGGAGTASQGSRAEQTRANQAARDASQQAAMVARYQDGSARSSAPRLAWRVTAIAWCFLSETSTPWDDVAAADGWDAPRDHAASRRASGAPELPAEPPFGTPAFGA